MQIQKFTSAHEMIAFLKTLGPSDHFKIAKAHGIKPTDKAQAHLYADYIVQGVSKGLSGASLTQYAEANVARLSSVMPHLVSQLTQDRSKAPAAAAAKVAAPKAPKAAKAPKVKAAPKVKVAKAPKAVKVKHPDFTIVARPDRGGFEGWHSGKAEAFRDTVEKVQAFFTKKYGQPGNLLA